MPAAGWAALGFAALGALLIGLLALYGIYKAFRDLVRTPLNRTPVRVLTGKKRQPEARPKTPRDRFNKGYFLAIAGCFGLAALSGVVAGVAAIAG